MPPKPRRQQLLNHLDELKHFLCDLLGKALPKICTASTDWWGILVKGAVQAGFQGKQVLNGQITRLNELDLTSLVNVLDRNLASLLKHVGKTDNSRIGKGLCHDIKSLRNILAHDGAGEDVSLDDAIKYLESIRRLLMLLGSSPEFLRKIETDWQELGRQRFQDTKEVQGPAIATGVTPPPVPTKAPNAQPGSPVSEELLQSETGIPLDYLLGKGAAKDKLQTLLGKFTYIGIDFGTSTTIATCIKLDNVSGHIVAESIPIPQLDELGRTITDHIVPSCVAWHNEKLLVGRGAAELKSTLVAGKNIWFSFKMELGLDLGPKYFNSKLQGGDKPVEILRPQDAARVFFIYLKERIEDWVRARGLPSEICYAVSVPASFESNQRSDLSRVLQEAGISVPARGIMDEPNAAFISTMVDNLRLGSAALDPFRLKPKNILVFDFGAGTCDISVLRVEVKDERMISRNLAISQFRALGGDNIDRSIARNVLWPAMRNLARNGKELSAGEIENLVVPRLLGCAEQLKVHCCKAIEARWNGRDSSPFRASMEKFTSGAVPKFFVGDTELELPQPSIELRQFFDLMEPFLKPVETNAIPSPQSDTISIFEPIRSALDKAGLDKDELDQILFIGGSAQNPLVLEAIQKQFGRFVECRVGPDIRTPVSKGVAVHSLCAHGLQVQIIRPILSEAVYLITAGRHLHRILSAGTPIPSEDITFTDGLIIQNDAQPVVQMPICVSNERKTLGMLEIRSPSDEGFARGTPVTLVCRVDENKLLRITAKAGSSLVESALLNPLANEDLTPEETRRLMARQNLNESIVAGNGKPSPTALCTYAEACQEASRWTEAVDSFEALERIAPECRTHSSATNLCFLCEKAGLHLQSNAWAERAYERRKTWVTAFNLSITMEESGRQDRADALLEEAAQFAPNNPVLLSKLGQRKLHLNQRQEGLAALQKALSLFRQQHDAGSLDLDDVGRFIRVASLLERPDLVAEGNKWREQLSRKRPLYDERFLAASKQSEILPKG